MRRVETLSSLPQVNWVALPVERKRTAEFKFNRRADRRDVPFVPTPQRVVNEVLRMAQLKERDVIYDLGCGDGRIVIAAAKQSGARGIGIDIDPQRIKSSHENSKSAGVDDRVRFLQQSFFETDLRDATVVTLYLLPWVNMQLRPKLLKELRPGARIISHAFSMTDWLPDQIAEVAEGQIVYRWTVPTDVRGAWNCTLRLRNGRTRSAVFRFQQQYQIVIGWGQTEGRSLALEQVKMDGMVLNFLLRDPATEQIGVKYRCTVDGDAMHGVGEPVEGKFMKLELRARRIREDAGFDARIEA